MWQIREAATSAPHSGGSASTIRLNDSRFSPFSIASMDAPISSTPYRSRTPEAAAGPHDSAYLFDRFVELMEGRA